MLTAYRIVYGLVLLLFLGNVLRMIPFATSVLSIAVVASLICVLVLLVGFTRIQPVAFWVFVLVWEALFAWYAWFSPIAPFVLHETRSFDPLVAAKQARMHLLIAETLFCLLVLWFLTLPIARVMHGRRTPTSL